jgi:peptide/nickel transport system substrate-binding protein
VTAPLRAALAALALALPLAAPAAPRPVYGGELRTGLPAVPRETDPARAAEPADLLAARALHAPLLALDAAGALAPALLAEIPAPEAGGRAFRLVLREGLAFSDGAPLRAADVAAGLARLLDPAAPSPHAWVALAIAGADEVLAGRARELRGVQVLSDRELLVTLAFPFPAFPRALAALPAAPVSPRGAGAGAFRLPPGGAAPGALRLVPNEHHHRGRPFADALVLSAIDPRGAARALERGDLDLVLRAEAAGGAPAPPLPLTSVTWAAVSARRPGGERARRALARALDALDRTELVRRFVRGPAEPLRALLPRAAGLDAAPLSAPTPEPGAPPARVALLVAAGSAEARAVADRLQVLLHDRGVAAAVEPVEPGALGARVRAGDYDVALLGATLLSTEPALAAAQVALLAGGPEAARRALEALASAPPGDPAALAAAAERVREGLGLVPLYASAPRASRAPALQGLAPRADGGLDPGDLWRYRGELR